MPIMLQSAVGARRKAPCSLPVDVSPAADPPLPGACQQPPSAEVRIGTASRSSPLSSFPGSTWGQAAMASTRT